MSESLSALLYLVASICFIMALRGLSSPETARGGNIFGIVGMVIAILTTLASPEVVSYWLIVIGIVIGGAVGAYIARQIQMTALPQLVAAFHSLVGLAAVCVAAAAFAAPEAYGIGIRGAIHPASLVEMAIGLTIGAITFTGSVGATGNYQFTGNGGPVDVTLPRNGPFHIDATANNSTVNANFPGASVQNGEVHADIGRSPHAVVTVSNNGGTVSLHAA